MNRRKFTSITALGAIALSTTGFIRFNGTSYEGDCETTTDILGPFYRPDAPVRNNLVIEGAPGDLVELSGIVNHKNCSGPFKGAKVELWHCSADEIYDNDSDEYRYRGTTFCDDQGHYSFLTQMPVPYDAGGGNYRPAHFHMLISAEGYQSLVTQVYFTGDPYLKKDSSSASPTAKARILPVENGADGKKKVTFNVTMQDILLVEPAAMDRLVGTYSYEKGGGTITLFKKNGQLWLKNEVFGVGFDYVGNNTFAYPGLTDGAKRELKFDLLKDGAVKITRTDVNNGRKRVRLAMKKA